MKNKYLLTILFLLVTSYAYGWGDDGYDTGPVMAERVQKTTVANLPASVVGNVAIITDGNSATDCTGGGGSIAVFCVYDGSAWTAGSGGGGGTLDATVYNDLTWGDGTESTIDWTYNVLAGTDPVVHFGSSSVSFDNHLYVDGIGTGIYEAYDVEIGSDSYGGIRLGQMGIYSTDQTQGGDWDLGGAMVLRNEANLDTGNDPGIEFAILEGGNTARFVIPESGADNATAMIRSVTIAGPYVANNDIVTCSHWGANKIDCDTGGTGADLFVQDDLEVNGNIYADAGLYVGVIVGIGTTAPSGILDIEGGDVFLGTASLDNTSSDEDLLISGNLEVENDAYFDAPITPYSNVAPVTSEDGEFAFRTNGWAANRGSLQVFDGTANTIMVGTIYSDSPNNGQIPKWNTGGTITWENDDNSAGITGTDTRVLYFNGNDNPAGNASFTFNDATGTVTATAFETTPSSTPLSTFTDSDAGDGDVSAQIFVNCTDTGSGTEDCDMALQTQEAGVMTNAIYIDADVGVNITGVLSENTRTVSGTYSKGWTLNNPLTTDVLVPLWTPNIAITFTRMYCVTTEDGIATINFTDDTNDTDQLTCVSAGQEDDGAIANASFSADETVYMEVQGLSGTVPWVNMTGDYTID